MRRAVWLMIVVLLVGCSTSEDGSVDKASVFISTGSESSAGDTKLYAFLKGEWLEVAKNCDSKGNVCETVQEQTRWIFNRGEVTWGSFTHPLSIENDTLYIAGYPYSIASELKDTILLHTVQTNQYFKLVRK